VHSILRHILFLLPIFALDQTVFAQTDSTLASYFIIDSIHIEGNKRTKTFIIERELDFSVGDTVLTKNIEGRLQRTQNRLFNTSLFLETNTQLVSTDAIHKTVKVTVRERYYTYIVPIIGLADRNFNEWWVQRNHNLNRLDIGLYFLQKNMRGRNESMKIKVEFGFTKKAEFTYTIPYLTKSRKLGLIYYIGYITNRLPIIP
jgi:outer membrane protein assembly factor BamA